MGDQKVHFFDTIKVGDVLVLDPTRWERATEGREWLMPPTTGRSWKDSSEYRELAKLAPGKEHLVVHMVHELGRCGDYTPSKTLFLYPLTSGDDSARVETSLVESHQLTCGRLVSAGSPPEGLIEARILSPEGCSPRVDDVPLARVRTMRGAARFTEVPREPPSGK